MAPELTLTLLALSVALSFWAPLRRIHRALGLGHLAATGHAYLLLGAVAALLTLGPTQEHLSGDLAPVLGFVAAWVGFAAGMRFDRRVLRPLPARAWIIALAPAVTAAVTVGGASAALLLAADVPPTEALAAALVLAAAAASSGPTLVALLRGRRAGRDPAVRARLAMAELSAGLDDLLVILLATLAFAFLRPPDAPLSPALLTLASLGAGVGLGGVAWLFLGGRASEDERLLLGLGMLLLTAGFATWLALSPASVAALAAITLVNLPGERGQLLFAAIRRVERPAVVILMTILGFDTVGPQPWLTLPLIATLTLLRLAAKHAAGDAVAGPPLPGAPGLHPNRGWALALAPQGALGLVVALSFFGLWHDATARSVLTAIAVAALINELLAPWLLSRALRAPDPSEDHP